MKKLFIIICICNTVYSQWSTNPYVNLQVAVHGGNIHVVPDGNGGAIITFNNFDYEEVTSYLQAIDKYGYIRWSEAKILANNPGPKNYIKDLFLDNTGSVLAGYISGYSYIDSNLVPTLLL